MKGEKQHLVCIRFKLFQFQWAWLIKSLSLNDLIVSLSSSLGYIRRVFPLQGLLGNFTGAGIVRVSPMQEPPLLWGKYSAWPPKKQSGGAWGLLPQYKCDKLSKSIILSKKTVTNLLFQIHKNIQTNKQFINICPLVAISMLLQRWHSLNPERNLMDDWISPASGLSLKISVLILKASHHSNPTKNYR